MGILLICRSSKPSLRKYRVCYYDYKYNFILKFPRFVHGSCYLQGSGL